MAEEYIMDRERELLDYLRNNVTDTATVSRITAVSNETFTATNGQTAFTLSHNLVKNVADTILKNSAILRKGYDYTVGYGEGAGVTIVTLLVGATTNDSVKISYSYGSAMIEREFSRTDSQLPRVVLMFLTGDENPASLGDAMEYGLGTYADMTYRLEVRSQYASEARLIASRLFNMGPKIRQANLFRTNIVTTKDLQNFDYDIEKNCYIWQLSLNIQWEVKFG